MRVITSILALMVVLWGPVVARAQEPTPPAPQPEAPPDPGDPSFPGSWPMFGSNTRMKIGGYVKADFLYDFDGTLDRKQFLMSTIPVVGTPEHANSGYVSFFAQETRFNFDVRRTEPGARPLKLYVEGDFWPTGQSGSVTLTSSTGTSLPARPGRPCRFSSRCRS